MYGGGYGGGMYGGYGGYGGMGGYGGGMYGRGMYGMGGMGGPMSGGYAETMFRMTEMLEMNSMMLDQLQEHVSMTYNRLRDVVVWVLALRTNFFPKRDLAVEAPPVELPYESVESKGEALQVVWRRLRVLLVLFGLFLFFVRRDSRRRMKEFEADTVWLKVGGDALVDRLPAIAAAKAALDTVPGKSLTSGMGGGMMGGGMMGGGMMGGYGGGMGGMGSMYGSSMYGGGMY